MKGKKHGIQIALIFIVVIAIMIGVVMLIVGKSNMFDTSGGFVKDMADDKDTISFMNRAEQVSYYEVVTGKVEDFKDKAIKYYGYITNKEVDRDKKATYRMIIALNKKDSQKLKGEYETTKDGYALVPLEIHTPKAYNNFALGDYVWMYGELDELKEQEGVKFKLPRFECKKLVLEVDEEE